jgi:hypothetical protein
MNPAPQPFFPILSKTNPMNTIRHRLSPRWFACLAWLAVLVAPMTWAVDFAPPLRMSFQGFLTDSAGTPRGNSSVETLAVTFRLYRTSTAALTDAIWAETQNVIVDKGHFSVVLGEGTAISGYNSTLSASLFSGNDTDNGRYLGVTVGTETEVAPRIQFFTTPYSFLSRYATELIGTGGNTVLKLGASNVGINLSGSPSSTLDVGGTITGTGLTLLNNSLLQLGSGISGRQTDAGKIGYDIMSGDTHASLDIVGAGTSTTDRKITLWAEGGTMVRGPLLVGAYTASSTTYANATANSLDVVRNNRLAFSGGSPIGAWDSENSDPLWLSRYNAGADATHLRLNIGDGADANDKLDIGHVTGTTWVSKVSIDATGNINATGAITATGHISTSASIGGDGLSVNYINSWGGGGITARSGSSIQSTSGQVVAGIWPTYSQLESNGNITATGSISSGGGVTVTSGGVTVTGGKIYVSGYQATTFNNQAQGDTGGWGDKNIPNSIWNVSIHAEQGVIAQIFSVNSDRRIKDILGLSDAKQDLSTLKKIEVTDYQMKDRLIHGSEVSKKVIAQQVESVLPQAVKKTTGTLPDIYQKAQAEKGWVLLKSDLKKGEKVRIIGQSGDQVYEVSAIAEPGSPAFDAGARFQVSPALPDGKVFVYGREVNDFRTVDYDALSMLNISATQELIRRVESQGEELARLRDELAKARKEKQQLTAHVSEMDSRLARLEGMLRQRASTPGASTDRALTQVGYQNPDAAGR